MAPHRREQVDAREQSVAVAIGQLEELLDLSLVIRHPANTANATAAAALRLPRRRPWRHRRRATDGIGRRRIAGRGARTSMEAALADGAAAELNAHKQASGRGAFEVAEAVYAAVIAALLGPVEFDACPSPTGESNGSDVAQSPCGDRPNRCEQCDLIENGARQQ